MGQAEEAASYDDPEISAMHQIAVTLAILEVQAADDDQAIPRVLRWACQRWGVEP